MADGAASGSTPIASERSPHALTAGAGAPVVAVIGGGFSGAMVAANLLASARGRGPLRVVLVDPSRAGRGVAYGTASDAHVLNVPAAKMSAWPSDPDHFVRHLAAASAPFGPASFVPRATYGAYVESTLRAAALGARPGATLEIVRDRACEVAPSALGATVRLARGGAVTASRVVLALGALAPRTPSGLDEAFVASPRYVADPWADGGAALDGVAEDEPLLLVGTGLTMFDVVLRLEERGHRGPVLAVSRRGLVPHAHAKVPPGSAPCIEPRDRLTARDVVRAVRAAAAEAERDGRGFRAAIDALRAGTPAIFGALSHRDRARLLRHAGAYWDVVRHRASPDVAAAIDARRASGALRVTAARVVAARDDGGAAAITLRPRGAGETVSLRAARVVNCTGPSYDVERAADPLVARLRERGLLRADPLRLGIDADAAGRVVDRAGSASSVLFAAGPLRRAATWEGTAVPELRVQAADVADAVLASLAERACAHAVAV